MGEHGSDWVGPPPNLRTNLYSVGSQFLRSRIRLTQYVQFGSKVNLRPTDNFFILFFVFLEKGDRGLDRPNEFSDKQGQRREASSASGKHQIGRVLNGKQGKWRATREASGERSERPEVSEASVERQVGKLFLSISAK